MSPVTVIDAPPLSGVFKGKALDMTGALKVKPDNVVPATAPTVSCARNEGCCSVALRHLAVVAELHVAVLHTAAAKEVDAEKSKLPKLRPVTVTDVWPVCAVLSSDDEATGTSKESDSGDAVPPTAPTVKLNAMILSETDVLMHCTELELDQLLVAHAAVTIEAVAEKSRLPNCNPDTVTEVAPVDGMLYGKLAEVTAESNVNTELAVPATAATVTEVDGRLEAASCIMHVNDVLVNHESVLHSWRPRCVDCVKSTLPKFNPSTVKEAPPPVCNRLYGCAYDATGLSNVNMSVLVLMAAPTVSCTTAM